MNSNSPSNKSEIPNNNVNQNNTGSTSSGDTSPNTPPVPQTTIKFDESQNQELKEYQIQHHEKYSQKPLSRSSTGQSSTDFDTKSVRSVMMHKLHLIKRRRKSIDDSERVEGPPYHTMDLDTVTQLLKSDLEDGLPESDIEVRRGESGFNEMEGEGGVSPIKLLIKQFTNIMVLILLIAMVIFSVRRFHETNIA